uniref:Ferritin/DPS domain-containing protein n=1 Tax=Athene cunicularia TaxID=194338 RepID=A0A663M5F9_ATHCN
MKLINRCKVVLVLFLGEHFDQSHVALPNVSKFFLHQALEERKAAEALMKYQQERGGHYCSKTIQVGSRQQAFKQLQSTVINFLHYVAVTSGLCIHPQLDFWIEFPCHISVYGFVLVMPRYCHHTVLTLCGCFLAQKDMNSGPLFHSLTWRLLFPVCCNGL